MCNKGAGLFSLIASGGFIAIWWVYLFGVKPDCLSSFEAVKQALLFAASPSQVGSWFFVYTLTSISVCMLCAVLFFSGHQTKMAFALTLLHGFVGIFLYTWSLVLFIFLPLTFASKAGISNNA